MRARPYITSAAPGNTGAPVNETYARRNDDDAPSVTKRTACVPETACVESIPMVAPLVLDAHGAPGALPIASSSKSSQKRRVAQGSPTNASPGNGPVSRI